MMKIRTPLPRLAILAAAIVVFVAAPVFQQARTADEDKPPAGVKPQSVKERAIEEWRGMRFGLFIHWGPVSLKGTEIGWSRGAQVPKEEYDALYKDFDPVRFDAAEWVRTARQAGMRYLVITSKHHDGFCLWDTEFTDYDIMSTPFKRDVLAELSAACSEQGVRFGVYYSVCDWFHPDYPLDSPGGREPKEEHDMPRYYEYLRNQTREILEKYGPVCVYWFDGDWEKPWTNEYGNGLYDFLMELQPDLVINNRVSKGRRGMAGTTIQTELNAGDFDTPEQQIGSFSRARPWETCMTICRQWAWKPEDEMKSLKECLRTLLRVVGGDGNLLFNVGPMPDGRIEQRQKERLLEMGQWLRRHGRCVYGTRGGPFIPGRWGAATCRGNRIWLLIFEWPQGDTLMLPTFEAAVSRATALTGGEVAVDQTSEGIAVRMAKSEHDAIVTVIELEIDGEAFDIEPVPVFPFGRPVAIEGVKASNIFKDMEEFGAEKAVDGDERTRWATDSGTAAAWLEVDLGAQRTIGAAWIMEAYAGRIQAFELQREVSGRWIVFHTGKAVEADCVLKFPPVTAQRFRLNILEASEGPTVHEFQLYEPGKGAGSR